MSATCLNIFDKLNESIDSSNYELIDHMTDPKMRYAWVCIKPDLTYEYFYSRVKYKWEQDLNGLVNNPSKCTNKIGQITEIMQYASPDNIQALRQMFSSTSGQNIDIDSLVLDVAANYFMKNTEDEFIMDRDFSTNIKNLGQVLVNNCQCEVVDIFKLFAKKYKRKYGKKFDGKSKAEIINILREDYGKFKEYLGYLHETDKDIYQNVNFDTVKNKYLGGIRDQLTNLYGFSVESELERLIPSELGSLKTFFTKIIATYYNNLHPIIWTQIFKSATEKLFVDLPFTKEEIFSFGSKQILLNSGPFILKILQTIRPVLSPELAQKYNLTKLTYPLLKKNEIDLMLRKVVYDWDMYDILENFSASVGHVSKVKKVNYPLGIFIIKMIKPLAVAQSCWEYKTLYNIYPEGSCEQDFIKNLLNSNARELDVQNEINNLNNGHEYYTDDYSNVFSVNLDAKLTTIQHIENIIVPDCWYALAMTLAPGIPLSKLVENDLIKSDTRYRAKLHRCLDILVYKFFFNIVQNGFYHGDLHAGNIFFSYDQSQMTLIDFGAVGHLDIYSDNPDTKVLLNIVIKSLFYNYDEMFDELSALLNTKCVETQIDMDSLEYQKLKQVLYNHKIENLRNMQIEKRKQEIYKNDIFSKKRIEDETSASKLDKRSTFDPSHVESIYSYLEIAPPTPEIIVENKDVLPQFTEIIGTSTSISFAGVLEKIIKYYASSGINIAIKFSEFYEFQKAYALLLGVLHKVGYNSYRSGIAIGKAIKNWRNIKAALHVGTTAYVVKEYLRESSKSKNIRKHISSNLTENSIPISANPNVTDPNQMQINDLAEILKNSINSNDNMNDLDKIVKYRIKIMDLKAQDLSA